MREIRQSGSEGGATSTIVPTPILGPRPCRIFVVIRLDALIGANPLIC